MFRQFCENIVRLPRPVLRLYRGPNHNVGTLCGLGGEWETVLTNSYQYCELPNLGFNKNGRGPMFSTGMAFHQTACMREKNAFWEAHATRLACIQQKSLPNSTQLRGYNEGFVINAG